MIRAALIAIPLSLTGCNLLPESTASLEQLARQELDAGLYDAPSARFRDLRKVEATLVRGKSTLLCGAVNAKNQFGAYVGWRPFYVILDNHTAVVEDENGGPAGFSTVYPNCALKTY